MFKSYVPFVLLIVMLMVNSCRTPKDLTYLADMPNDSLMKGLPADAPDYRIRPDDNLYVTVQSLNEEVTKLFNYSSSMVSSSGAGNMLSEGSGQIFLGSLVDKEGNITLPVLGKVKVGGCTLSEAQANVQGKADEYLKDATVKVKLLSFKYTMSGEVKTPGMYYNYNPSINVLEAVSKAGGFTDQANLKTVLLIRKTKEGTKSYRINFSSRNLLSHPAYYLQPNDLVYAEPAKTKAIQINTTTLTFIASITSVLSFVLVLLKF